jgi:hypothetical protein
MPSAADNAAAEAHARVVREITEKFVAYGEPPAAELSPEVWLQ